MPQISVGDFKKGVKVIYETDPYELVEVNFRKPGKGAAVYETKMRNLLKGTILEKNFRSGESLEEADVHRTDGIYSYFDANGYVFMDNDSYEQHTLPAESVAERVKFLKEGAEVGMLFWNGQLIDMTPPQHVVLEVTYAEPAAKGNTATNVTKQAEVETGASVSVPAFINEGDKIKIDASTGSYIERVRS